jgi:hypothetical protein
MSGAGVPERTSSPIEERSPRVERVAAEDAWGERLRAWVARSGAKSTDVARGLGLKREDLYEVYDGVRHMRAAWLELLPPAVERLFLEERARAHGLELRQDEPRGSCTTADIVRELAEVMTVASQSDADGYIDVEEAEREEREWADLERVMTARRAQLREAVRRRGLRIAGGGQ